METGELNDFIHAPTTTGRTVTTVGRGKTIAVALLLLALAFLGLGRGLWTPDEPREAEISREMWLSPGVIPTLDGTPFIEKPPLYYWAVAATFAATGGPSAAAARAVSGLAGLLTLLVVFLWGRRAHSPEVGLLAALLLATSVQFLVSTHWVLLDPVLMLFTTLAAWAAWELVQGRGGWRGTGLFYLAVVLALWTKGLIGPVLLGAGLAAYCLLDRRRRPWRAFHPVVGAFVLAAAVGALGLIIYRSGGAEVFREWAWVNHVQRFIHPTTTGHRKPLPYYLWTLPVAVLPWLVLLVDALRPVRWKETTRNLGVKRFAAAMVVGMVLVLSASSTKRETYLLPLLPPLFLLFAVNASEWWEGRQQRRRWGVGWWTQLGLVGFVTLVPAAAAMVYLHRPDPVAVAILAAGMALLVLAVASARRRRAWRAVQTMVACALVGAVGLTALPGRVLDGEKDMAPFVARIGAQLPPGSSVDAVGEDETLQGIVPFVTGRRVIGVDRRDLVGPDADAANRPEFVVVQSITRRHDDPTLGSPYELLESRTFGNARTIALWRLSVPATGAAGGG